MVAKKTAAKKATKTVAKPPAKSAAKPLAKKVASAKTKKSAASASGDEDRVEQFAKAIAGKIESGDFDSHIVMLDDAITARMNRAAAENRKAAKTAQTERKVSPAPKKSSKPAESASVEPVEGTEYVVKEKFAKLAGAVVEFVRFKPDTDNEKIVVVMKSDKPGNPKGKRIAIPLSAIEEKKSGAKKGPARKKKK